MKTTIPSDTIVEEDADLSESVKNGVKKAKRKSGLIACVATIVTICLLVLGVNEFFGWGVCFTNIDNIIIAHQFMGCIKNGDYEKAAEMQEETYKQAYREICDAMKIVQEEEDWEERKPFYEAVIGVSQTEYVEARKQEFISHMKLYEEHINLKSFHIDEIYDKTTIVFAIKEEYLVTEEVFPCNVNISAYSGSYIKCVSGSIREEETQRENYKAYEQCDLFSAINDGGIYYEGPIWNEE